MKPIVAFCGYVVMSIKNFLLQVLLYTALLE
jgi:hypothetical protein